MKKYLLIVLIAIFFLPVASQAAKFSFGAMQDFEQFCPAQIDILIDPQGALTNAADAFIKYNPNEIVVDEVTKGDAYEVYLTPVIDSANGLIKYSAFSLFSSLNKPAVFGHIRFHSKSSTMNTKFDWLYSAGSTTDCNIARTADSQDILSETPLPQVYGFYATDGYCDEDKIAPTVDSKFPLPGSVNNPLDSSVSFVFKDNRSGVDINSVAVNITNNDITTEYRASDFDYALIDRSPKGEPRAYLIVINPNPSFVSRKSVTVRVTGRDLAGNSGGDSWNFNNPEVTCEDLGCSGGETTVCDQNLSLLASPGNKQVSLEWLPSLNTLGFERIMVNRLECSSTLQFPTPSSGQNIYDGSGYSYVDTGGLVNGVQYCYTAYGYRNNNGAVEYTSGAFARATPNCYMQPITDFNVTNQNSGIMLSWLNPRVDNLGSIKIIRQENGCPNKWLPDGWEGNKVVYDGTGESFFDANAVPGKDFCYLAFAHSNDGCFSPGALESTSKYTTSTDGFTPEYHFYTNKGILELTPSGENLNLLLNKDLTIITNSKFLKPVENIIAEIGDNAYSLMYNSQLDQYSLRLENFNSLGTFDGNIVVVYSDQTVQYTPLDIIVNPLGVVEDGIMKKKVSGAEVILVDAAGTIFIGANQKNPLLTESEGVYGFMVPNGRYRVIVRQDGKERYKDGVINVTNNIVNQKIVLTPSVINLLTNGINNPTVQTTNKYVAPAVAALATINAIASIPWWNFWYYLQYLFTEFIPWLFRRKRKGWGVVYNSITKAPIDLAVVRLYEASSKKLLQSKITDKQGRYIFLAETGQYYLEVYKSGFDFPSEFLKSTGEDKKYSDIYHGEVITVREGEKGAIIANIPMDQHELKASDKQIFRDHFWQAIKNNISYIGPIFGIVALIISPGWIMAALTIFHIILFLLFRRLARKQKAKSWGVVYNAKNKKPLAKSIARIFSPEYNRMLEAYVTDRYGRYGFLAGNNVYYITAEKEGYESYKTANIDLSKGEIKVVGKDMPLNPLQADLSPAISIEPKLVSGEESSSVNNSSSVVAPSPDSENIQKEPEKPKESIWG